MQKKLKIILLIGLLWAAQFASARQFYLMTVEPGSEFWSVYGHTALVIDDDVYGFGVFSFEQENFYSSFVQNEMSYMVGHTEIDSEIYWAEQEQRRLTLMPLNLSGPAKKEIINYLRWHFLPENQSYSYDYFLQNCATKIRDILNESMNGELEANFTRHNGGSYFSQTFPVHNQSLMTFALAVTYGHAAYQQRSDWELMAFPMYLRQQLTDVTMDKWHGPIQVKVNKKGEQSWMVFLQTHVFLIFLSVLLSAGLLVKISRNTTIKLCLFIQTLIGCLLLYLWFGTAHLMAAWNVQLLLFSPLAFMAWRIPVMRYVLWVSVVLWLPVSIWQGSWYLWPLAVINVLMLTLLNPQIFKRRSMF